MCIVLMLTLSPSNKSNAVMDNGFSTFCHVIVLLQHTESCSVLCFKPVPGLCFHCAADTRTVMYHNIVQVLQNEQLLLHFSR